MNARRAPSTHHLHVVIKLSKLCNLRCEYCFEYDQLGDPARMEPAQLRQLFLNIRDYARTLPAQPRVLHLVLHGGEPLLLPPALVRELLELRDEIFAGEPLRTRVELQTNLVRLSEASLAMLRETRVGVGVSHDVVGGARVDITGRERHEAVLRNFERLRAAGVPFGGISVLHRGNLARVDAIFDFWYAQGVDFRLLPILDFDAGAGRCHGLGLRQDQVREAMLRLAERVMASPRRITVEPIDQYVWTALRYLRGEPGLAYDPSRGEWALVVDTDGETYTYGDSYTPAGRIGNFFEPGAVASFAAPAYARTLAARSERMGACESCPFSQACSRLHLGEAVPSERVDAPPEAPHRFACPVARPLIEHVVARIGSSPLGRVLVARVQSQGALPPSEAHQAASSAT
ncbi:radical SAM protein [Nannocystis bainbridge]|uniref:Radical SAM protein n=1 Tax=Nannocystis bainbridge TaxID=2995303 RepID=A0ABT5E6B2_9BACT|nr:radical SAM protein [Nannocystis bainbridge]MDC0720879.1 radical SAM protein [Nannocystis bainbridge]